MEGIRILCLGAGRMANAMIAGLIHNSGVRPEQIIVSNQRDERKLQALHAQYGVRAVRQWQGAVSDSDLILLAVPPHAHADILKTLSTLVDRQLVVTVAAGTGVSYLERFLPTGTPTAWVMPNTAAHVRESISLYTRGTWMRERDDRMLAVILGGIGTAHACTEQEVEQLTAITGSAPTLVYRLAGALEAICRADGFPPDVAARLVRQMIFGSAKMLLQGTPTGELIDEVASPGGTTEAGLEYLNKVSFEEIIAQTIAAIHAREAALANRS